MGLIVCYTIWLWTIACILTAYSKTIIVFVANWLLAIYITYNDHIFLYKYYINFVYRQLPNILNRFTSADGFLFLQDNTILNYWNLMQADKNKLWIPNKVINRKTVGFFCFLFLEIKKVVFVTYAGLQILIFFLLCTSLRETSL